MKKKLLTTSFLFLLPAFPTAVHADSSEYLDKAVQIVCSSSQGAGFQIDSSTVITARHVVENCRTAKLISNSKETVYSDKITLSEKLDLAYIEISKGLVPISILSTTPINGSIIYTVGAPINGLVLTKGTLVEVSSKGVSKWLTLQIGRAHV